MALEAERIVLEAEEIDVGIARGPFRNAKAERPRLVDLRLAKFAIAEQ